MSVTEHREPPIHQVIRTRREQAGISQRELAERMRCAQAYISKIESGKSRPNIKSLEAFARALGTTPWRILKDAYAILYPRMRRVIPN